MDIPFEPIERATVSEEIIKQIIAQINTGKLPPGSKLPSERDLMESFHVSRSPVREALHALTMIGILETVPGAGTFVSKQLVAAIIEQLEWPLLLGNRELVELMEIREPLEIQAAGLAAGRATPESVQELREAILAYHGSLADLSLLMDAEVAIHLTIARMSGNPLLIHFITTFQKFLKEYWLRKQVGFTTSPLPEEEYWQILGCIEQGDDEGARMWMTRHLKMSKGLALVKQINDHGLQRETAQTKAEG